KFGPFLLVKRKPRRNPADKEGKRVDGGDGPSSNRFNVLYEDSDTPQEAGEVREANVEAWSQGVTSKDK
ncbi:cellulose synthase A catalytic subunit 1, partial [Corchorus olitorius]